MHLSGVKKMKNIMKKVFKKLKIHNFSNEKQIKNPKNI